MWHVKYKLLSNSELSDYDGFNEELLAVKLINSDLGVQLVLNFSDLEDFKNFEKQIK